MTDMSTPHEHAIAALVARLAGQLEARGWRLATAESCTGGLVAAACTERAGSSLWFERGVVSYSNASKSRCLGVPAGLIEQDGAVSLSVAEAMARGAQAGLAGVCGLADLSGLAEPDRPGQHDSAAHAEPAPADPGVETALAITGVAGPSGGSVAKPVGTVCFAWAVGTRCWSERHHFDGDRAAVRRQSVEHALSVLVDALEAADPSSPAADTPDAAVG
jgi:nicotinamide-nucleotide amidase